MPDGYIGMFRVPDAGAIVPLTNDVSGMTILVTEYAVESGTGPTASKAVIDISDVDIVASGAVISEVIIQHKLSSEGTYANVGTHGVEWSGLDNVGKFTWGPVDWSLSGIEHDFRAYFQNSDGQLAIENVGGGTIGLDVYLSVSGVEFNGFDDLAEYPEVLDLVGDNASDIEGGTFADPSIIPSNGIIRLAWKDMKTHNIDEPNHPFADGSTDPVSVVQWKNIVGYKVFMYIAVPVTGDAPLNPYPNYNESASRGTWYLVGDTQDNFLEVDCPKDDKISFWVGAVLGRTIDDIPSATTPIPKIKYLQYNR
jgi:hypothetical protein